MFRKSTKKYINIWKENLDTVELSMEDEKRILLDDHDELNAFIVYLE